MKKVNKSNSVPNGLDTYQKANPNATWQEFTRNNRNGKKEVDECLKRDQRKLCAYCEITLSEFNGQGLDDFHVEHYYPKTPHSNHPQNWALDWNNLLAVCTGGRCKDIGKPDLFTSPDTSCDVPKDNKNLVGIILNPLIDIPAFPPLFEFNEDGVMTVGKDCPKELKQKALASINELNLSPPVTGGIAKRLQRFRKTVIDTIREQLLAEIDNGMQLEEAKQLLAEVYFSDDPTQAWPNFFSCIRWYLDSVAEERLKAINYNG